MNHHEYQSSQGIFTFKTKKSRRFRFWMGLSTIIVGTFTVSGLLIYFPGGLGSVRSSLSATICNTDSISKTVLFSRHKEYEDLSEDQNHLWQSLLPTKGFVDSPDSRHKGIYGIAMFHQVGV
jgi:hypothetical protein